jgi:thioredoxin-related protein
VEFNARNILMLLILAVFLAGCRSNSDTGDSISENTRLSTSNVQKIEIYHFHGTSQCYSCKTVGAYAEETINLYYAEELQSGKIVFDHINFDLPENVELARKYGVTGSSLWIGVYDPNGFHPEQNVNVWYKIQDKDDYLLYLKSVIDKRIAGDFS